MGVQPVAIYYGASGETLGRVAYVGDDTLVRSIWELLGSDALLAEVTFLPVLEAKGQDCRALANEAWLGVVRSTEQLALFEHEARPLTGSVEGEACIDRSAPRAA